jgi:hypothetical protein
MKIFLNDKKQISILMIFDTKKEKSKMLKFIYQVKKLNPMKLMHLEAVMLLMQ